MILNINGAWEMTHTQLYDDHLGRKTLLEQKFQIKGRKEDKKGRLTLQKAAHFSRHNVDVANHYP